MYKNKGTDGRNNICGVRVKEYRLALPGKPSQRAFADMLQLQGLDVDKNAVQRIESGQRFVTDIELKAIVKVLHVRYVDLLED
ncbi:MAG: helix-turn-helix transcriptional regulator [Clostridia bacterium]|nr:helix-turn-helix transcriptional regulator [Clostridia bacterium]